MRSATGFVSVISTSSASASSAGVLTFLESAAELLVAFLVAAPVFFGGSVEATASPAGFFSSLGFGVDSTLGFGGVASLGVGVVSAAATWVEATEGLATAAGPAATGRSMASILNPIFCASAPTNF